MGHHVRQSARRPLRCGSVTPLPWRTNLAVVLSIAAIAGCGQAPGPQAASDPSSGATGTAPDIAAPPGGTEGRRQISGDVATPDRGGRRGAAERSEPGDGAALAGGDADRGDTRTDPVSETTSAPVSDPAEHEPEASAPPRASDTAERNADVDDQTGADLDTLEHTVVALLGSARQDAGAPRLEIDAALVEDARDRACEMAQGTTPLLSEDDTENIGLVVEPEADTAARTMHDWWMQTPRTRDVRLTDAFTRYGVGACTAGERVYYSERFGL